MNRKTNFFLRRTTSSLRMLPSFINIGEAKCGTTSLFNYMIQHPNILPSFKKEAHFFDLTFDKGINFYKSFFPIQITNQNCITGEKTPYYLSHPLVADRIAKTFPFIKLILLLRNPIDRAFSHYHQQFSRNYETLSFENALKEEESRLKGEEEKMIKDHFYQSYPHRHYSYLKRGRYFEHISKWLKYFKKDQFLILTTEELNQDPQKTMNKIFDYLQLSSFNIKIISKSKKGTYKDQMDDKTRKDLIEYFKPYNENLYKFMNKDFGWCK
jgi:hypothetical protein